MKRKSLSPEHEFLLLALRHDRENPCATEASVLASDKGIKWDYLFNLAAFHAVRPQLANLVSDTECDLIPVSFRERLAAAGRENLYLQLRLAAEFFQVRDQLESHGITVVPFKGFMLGYEGYGNPAEREGYDVDVYMEENQVMKAGEVMRDAGYTLEHSFRGHSWKQLRRMTQELNFDRENDGMSNFHMELHWGIAPAQYGLGIGISELRDRIIKTDIQGRELTAFSPTAHLLLILLHHGGKDRFEKLKQVKDIAVMIGNNGSVDWQWLLATAGRLGALPVVYTAAGLASEICGTPVPVQLKKGLETPSSVKLVNDRFNSLMRPLNEYDTLKFNAENWLFRMRSRTGLILKLRITAATVKAVITR